MIGLFCCSIIEVYSGAGRVGRCGAGDDRRVARGGGGADIDRMQAFGALNDVETNGLAGLERFITVHLDG